MKDLLTKYELEKYVLQKSRNRFNKALKLVKTKNAIKYGAIELY